jgi:hypothetical protein
MAKFQVQLAGKWADYGNQEDKILKRAFMAGFKHAKFSLRGQTYFYDFARMVQLNVDSGKERSIRQPLKWKAPAKPLIPAGPATVITVPKGSAGRVIQVPHPRVKGSFISVRVPKHAKPGQSLLVPLPEHSASKKQKTVFPPAAAVAPRKEKEPVAAPHKGPDAAPEKSKTAGWSTGAKVATYGAAVAGVGAAAMGGAILGDHIAEHGVEETVDVVGEGLADAAEEVGDFAEEAGEWIVEAAEEVGDFAEEAGEWIVEAAEDVGDFAEDAGDWIVEAGEDMGDFVMDLF